MAVETDGLTSGAWAPKDESVLEEAKRIVDGPRQDDYGHPTTNCKAIAAGWGAILVKAGILKEGEEFPLYLVSLFMIVLKVMRHAHKPKRDNLVDIAGYARVGEINEG